MLEIKKIKKAEEELNSATIVFRLSICGEVEEELGSEAMFFVLPQILRIYYESGGVKGGSTVLIAEESRQQKLFEDQHVAQEAVEGAPNE